MVLKKNGLPVLPSVLQGVINQHRRTTLVLENFEIQSISNSYSLFAKYYIEHPSPVFLQCDVVFTSLNGILISDDNCFVLGLSIHCAVLFLNKLRERETYDPIFLMLVLLEELLHTLYLINDEWKVKETAASIVRQKFPELKLHQYFPDYFDQDDHRIVFDLDAYLS